MANEVFISYSRRDFEKVRVIKEVIDREVGIDSWMDLDGIESGDQFEDVIINAINRHDTLLFMMSHNSMQSEWALDEIDFAKRKEKRIVLIDLDRTEMTDKFYFRYHKYDNIIWDDNLQQEKLLNNLRSWFGKLSGTSNTPQMSAEEMYQKGMEMGGVEYAYNWPEEAFELISKAAELGHVKAQWLLGYYYKHKDRKLSEMWLRKAAAQNDTDAMFDLWDMLNYGNEKEAVLFLIKAAEQNNVSAQYKLSECYLIGEKGLPKDENERLKWLRRAAENGHSNASYDLGEYYRYKDKDEALKWYRMSRLMMAKIRVKEVLGIPL